MSLETISLQNIDFRIIYPVKPRKTGRLTIKLSQPFEIILSKPAFVPEFLIKRFLQSNSEEIVQAHQKLLSQKRHTVFPVFAQKGTLSFMGNEYPYEVQENNQLKVARIFFIKNTYQIIVPPTQNLSQRQKMIEQSLKKYAHLTILPMLNTMVSAWAQKMQLQYKTIRVKEVKGHWGSCSTKKKPQLQYPFSLSPKLTYSICDCA